MKSIHTACAFFLFMVLCSIGYGDIESRVAYLPVVSRSGDDRFSTVAAAIDDTVLLTLKLMGTYDVIEGLPVEDYSQNALIPFVREQNIDSVIFGYVDQEQNGPITISMSVWDRAAGEVVLNVDEEAQMLFDVFDASDQIVISLIEGFSGTHIGYGGLLFNPAGTGDYAIRLNGTYSGQNRTTMQKILIGEYNLKIEQDRPFGKYYIYDDTIKVLEDQTVRIDFTLPKVTKEEIERFSEIDTEVQTGWSSIDQRPALNDILDQTINRLSSFDGYFALQRKKYEEWFADYRYIDLDSRITNSRNADFDDLRQFRDQYGISYLDADNGDARIAGRFSELQNPYIEDLKTEIVPRISDGAIKIDGNMKDWQLIPIAIRDKRGDASEEGGDILYTKIAQDDERVYCLMVVDGESVYARNNVWYQTYFNISGGNIGLTWSYNDGRWHPSVTEWNQGTRTSIIHVDGRIRAGRGFFEASFPRAAVVALLGESERHSVLAQAGINSARLDSEDSPVYLKFGP